VENKALSQEFLSYRITRLVEKKIVVKWV